MINATKNVTPHFAYIFGNGGVLRPGGPAETNSVETFPAVTLSRGGRARLADI